MMYLVEGRNPKETRGQYVLSIESAYAILEEMKQDFSKVNIYEKVDGEYKRIEKWEREQTNYDWLNSLPIEEQAEAMANLVFRATGEYNRERYPSNRWFKKEYWLEWLKQPHEQKGD